MILKEFLALVNYDEFDICKNDNGQLKTICKINEFIPYHFLSDKLLNAEIEEIFIDDEHDDMDLFTIAIKWEVEDEKI